MKQTGYNVQIKELLRKEFIFIVLQYITTALLIVHLHIVCICWKAPT